MFLNSFILFVFTVHQASTRAKVPATNLALQHFDATYKNYFRELWPSVRIGMLTEQKYGALMNNFASNADVISTLQSQGCRDFIRDTREISDESKPDDYPSLDPAGISSNIQCFVFPRGDITRFKPAR